MQINRRFFLKQLTMLSLLVIVPIKQSAITLADPFLSSLKAAFKSIIEIINTLKKENSSIVLKTLNGRKFIRDIDTHYPHEEGTRDEETQCTLFFHAHREDEYGHFHTYIDTENGDLIHLLMISVDKEGRPISLCTLNQWVTDDFFVKSDELKTLFSKFKMNDELFPDKRIYNFVAAIFIAYKDVIFELFDERDQAIDNYIKQNTKKPFDDTDIEILSYKKINVFEDSIKLSD